MPTNKDKLEIIQEKNDEADKKFEKFSEWINSKKISPSDTRYIIHSYLKQIRKNHTSGDMPLNTEQRKVMRNFILNHIKPKGAGTTNKEFIIKPYEHISKTNPDRAFATFTELKKVLDPPEADNKNEQDVNAKTPVLESTLNEPTTNNHVNKEHESTASPTGSSSWKMSLALAFTLTLLGGASLGVGIAAMVGLITLPALLGPLAPVALIAAGAGVLGVGIMYGITTIIKKNQSANSIAKTYDVTHRVPTESAECDAPLNGPQVSPRNGSTVLSKDRDSRPSDTNEKLEEGDNASKISPKKGRE